MSPHRFLVTPLPLNRTASACVLLFCACSAPSSDDGTPSGDFAAASPEATASQEATPSPDGESTDNADGDNATEPEGTPAQPTEPIVLLPPPEPVDPVGPLPEVCGATTVEPTASSRPMDIILIVDTSSSMVEERQAVQNNINENFAQILEAQGIDYRVVLVAPTSRITQGGVCILDPLGPTIPCAERSRTANPHVPDRFFHVDARVMSRNAFCVLQRSAVSFEQEITDLPLDGWVTHLREDAFKSFLLISDDNIHVNDPVGEFRCLAGVDPLSPEEAQSALDNWLRGTMPEQFGSGTELNYVWHSIVGLEPKSDPTIPYESTEPIQTNTCDTAVNPGLVHQQISTATGGLRFPVCHTEDYNSVFNRLADNVIQNATIPCTWEAPVPTNGVPFDPETLNVTFHLQAGSETPLFNVAGAQDCGESTDTWYYDDPASPSQLVACPATCERLQEDIDGSRVELELGCPVRRAPVAR